MIPAPLAQYAGVAKLIGAGLILVVVWFHGYGKGNDAGEVAAAKAASQHSSEMRAIAERAREAEAVIRVREHQMADEVAAIANAYEEDRRAIEAKTRDAVLADLRAGRIRLRNDAAARCPVPAAAQASAAPGVDHVAAADGGEAARVAADAIGIGAEADAQLAACQAVIRTLTAASAEGAGKP